MRSNRDGAISYLYALPNRELRIMISLIGSALANYQASIDHDEETARRLQEDTRTNSCSDTMTSLVASVMVNVFERLQGAPMSPDDFVGLENFRRAMVSRWGDGDSGIRVPGTKLHQLDVENIYKN